jgi:Domain of unknown function (DUF222)
VLTIGDDVFTAPEDHLGNAAFARTMIGHLQAVELQQLADFARAHDGDEFAYLEVATELHISGREAQRRMAFAITLTERLPQTLAALKQGWIDEFKARLIADAVAPLSDEHALAVEAAVLTKAGRQTPGQLRNRLAKAVLAVDPEGAEERRQQNKRERRVEIYPTEPGQAVLSLHHTREDIAAMHAAIVTRARELKDAGGETRTLAQLEADVARDLLLSTGPQGGRVVEVQLSIPATTAAGADDQPCEVDGLPITAHAAREMMTEATRWRWTKTDPTTGAIVDVTSARYTPPTLLRDLVKIRDRTCRFPGCTRHARYCDIDHRVPWPLGPTCDTNCHCLCKRHHRAKHEGGWNVEVHGLGHYRWTSPSGRTYTVEPEPVVEPQRVKAPPLPPPEDDPPPF